MAAKSVVGGSSGSSGGGGMVEVVVKDIIVTATKMKTEMETTVLVTVVAAVNLYKGIIFFILKILSHKFYDKLHGVMYLKLSL
jgi:hypothetical protein